MFSHSQLDRPDFFSLFAAERQLDGAKVEVPLSVVGADGLRQAKLLEGSREDGLARGSSWPHQRLITVRQESRSHTVLKHGLR